MNRAVIQFTIPELKLIRERLGSNSNASILLISKLKSALESGEDSGIQMTEDDMELILDEFILPSPKDSEVVVSIREKIQQKLLDFRNQNKR